jgi:membrane protease YdiL (CAAX protease family)
MPKLPDVRSLARDILAWLRGGAEGWPARLARWMAFVRDPVFWAAMSLGLVGWFLPQGRGLSWPLILVLALEEEIVFRFGIQETLNRVFREQGLWLLGWGNLVTSVAFTLLHFLGHPPLWAALVFFPSLVFGYMWDRHRNLLPCWFVHAFYNLCLFYQPF